MKHLSLFSGIGGFDLAAEWMGWENVAHCEINPFGRKILNYYWPNAISYEDITKTDFSVHRGKIDILTGGFPCQPYSVMGLGKGKEDDRHLWPEMLRTIREIKPKWIVGENVRGIASWNGGMVFEEIQVDLETEGYKVLPLLLPAGGVDAQHRRDRIWFVAYTNCKRLQGQQLEVMSKVKQMEVSTKTLAAPKIKNIFKNFLPESYVMSNTDGISSRLDGITFPKWRNESIKAGGNAIVPQVAYQIFKAIEQYNDQETN